MEKHFYLAIMSSIVLGLYIPQDIKFAVTLIIISSAATYVGVNHKQFFPAKGGDDNE